MNINIIKYRLLVAILLITLVTVATETDYYDLLGVARDADSRTIRKAFKKLAVTKHPDKNTDNPKAHEEFTRINRAYEVLKDPDLRKKYDQFGEEGLKDDHPSNQYQSWNFYQQDFGLYDNDDEITTLDRSDFAMKVLESNELWFVNFYSPRCSHCRTLAPTWRELARDLQGVVRIGAVNCGDDWFLCNNEGIQGYPSLIMYPSRRRYMKEHSLEPIVTFALSFLPSTALDLTKFSFKSSIKSSRRKHLPWLITYCGDGGDCLSSLTTKKLAAVFEGLINVASIECYKSNKEICDEMGVEHGTYFYSAGKVEKNSGKEITPLDFREVTKILLEFLPDLTLLNTKDFEKMKNDLKSSGKSAWLVMFMTEDTRDLELRKLPALLSNIHVGRVDCRQSKSICDRYFIHKSPTFIIFKQRGLFEYHYGTANVHDVAEFAKQCSENSVSALEPSDFPSVVEDSKQNWIVDFFAPWCPPCMRLLPVFRKTSMNQELNVRFGTVDCTVHDKLCKEHKIRSYPSTIFFNKTTPFSFKGAHNERSIVSFIQDIQQPPGVIFDEQIWDELVERKKKEEIWLIDFFAPWCGPCQQLAPEWRKLAKSLKGHKTIRVGEVNCEEHSGLCRSQNVRSYPQVRLYPQGKKDAFKTFNGWFMNADEIKQWAYEFLPSKVVELSPTQFDGIMKDKEPWVVDFYAPWCGPCRRFFTEFNQISQTMEGRVKFGKLNCEKHNHVCQAARVQYLPSVRLYRGYSGRTQDKAGENIQAHGVVIQQTLNHIFPSKGHVGIDEEEEEEEGEDLGSFFFGHDEF